MSFDHIRAIVWDLDGTLYRYDADFIEACNVAAARTAIALGLAMTEAEAVAVAARSMREHGNSSKLFLERGIRYEDFHHPYHEAVDTTILMRNLELRAGLESLPLPMAVLTNASRDWARRTIDHLGLSHLFPDANLFALEDMGYASKAQSVIGFRKALDALGARAEHALMVEDLPRNLVKAKEIGMTTALVHHDYTEVNGDHVDHIFDDTLSLIKALS